MKFAKVMFSQVSVCPQVGCAWQGRHAWWEWHVWRGTCMAGCMHGGGACLAGGVCGRGHAWQVGGIHGRGTCVAGGCVAGRGNTWQVGACMAGGMCGRGVCMVGGVHGRGHAWQGGMHGRGCAYHTHPDPPARYYEIRSMSGRYASYCNAFLY